MLLHERQASVDDIGRAELVPEAEVGRERSVGDVLEAVLLGLLLEQGRDLRP